MDSKNHSSDTESWTTTDLEKASRPVSPTTTTHHDPHLEPIRSVATNVVHRPMDDPDGGDLLNLPSRVLNDTANITEYTEETAAGHMLKEVRSQATGQIERYELVTWKVGDPENPKNWPKWKKWWVTMAVALSAFVVALDSSVITADVKGPQKEFGVSSTVSLLAISLFVVGFGVGPLAFAPLSEQLGRWPVYTVTLGLSVIFIIPCAVAKNIETLLVGRALGGIAISAPMTLVAGTLADIWKAEERGVPMAFFSAAPFIGPAIGPLIGGFLVPLGWRWLYYIQLIITGAIWIVMAFFVPETYTPALLKKRAKKLRKETGDNKYVTEQDLDTRPFSQQMRIFLIRPLQLLFLEPIVLFISLYMSLLYSLLYVFFVAYPIVFEEGKGWEPWQTGLMFIPLAAGVMFSAAMSPLVNKHYIKLCRKHNNRPPPEVRLIPMMLSCWFIPIGLFIFAWTSYPRLTWVGPCLAGLPVGFGFIFLYNSANNYLVDSYTHQAASAMAAKTLIRSFCGAAVVLFTNQMYAGMGYQWATTLLAFLGCACCIIPFFFYYRGAKVRTKSRFAYAGEPAEEEVKK
ncbi:MFS general substrate transporter [Eremomyces bilateralis CBS 781.70]|uniref:MFS general substrate transporter n=1 Tax=Eremomyces bilateralis CBS 781.70 TaxID=1392243 RepID=A0A6G1FYQ1_9PEZI|nr:MFS general substrate transporter [Eremomyces bilateralis CBS 781.70]KAF1810830.1 MFS general substrate transporter [Eremomyces bilateralis CBS 781.70]